MLQEERARNEAQQHSQNIETQSDVDLAAPAGQSQSQTLEQAVASAAAASAATAANEATPAEDHHDHHDQTDRPGGSRRDLFPDIEQINSTLTAEGDRGTPSDAPTPNPYDGTPRQRAGFRVGFLAMIILAAGAGLAYFQAPMVANVFPAAAPAVQRYTDAVDGARFWLDERVRGGAEQMMGPLTGG